jgi:hypothetical protein
VSAVLLASLGLFGSPGAGVPELFAQQRPTIFHAPARPAASAPRPSNGFQGGGNQNQAPRNQSAGVGARNTGLNNPQNNPHLTEWMSRHRDMPLEQQKRALQAEPGFRELPAQTQQHYLDRLGQLNSMKPEERARMLEHNEEIEHLTGQQRQQVRGALLQLGTLPEDRRRLVARTFRDLRAMPEAQRQQYMSSSAYRSQFSDQERNTMSNLMSVEPYIPGHKAGDAPPQ